MVKKGKLTVLVGCIGFSILFSVLTLLWSESQQNSSIEWFGDDWGEAGDYVGKAMFDRDAYEVGGGPISEFIGHYVWVRLHPNDGFPKKRFVLIIWLLVCVSTGTIVGLVLITVRRPAFFQRKATILCTGSRRVGNCCDCRYPRIRRICFGPGSWSSLYGSGLGLFGISNYQEYSRRMEWKHP
jgi:hypothetical protein